jgi:hypothetical protein
MYDYLTEAALIAKRVNGPVKLVWTREDDLQFDYYRVGGFHALQGAVDANGKLLAWQNHFISFTADGKSPVSGGNLDGAEFPAPVVANVRVSQPCCRWRRAAVMARAASCAWRFHTMLHPNCRWRRSRPSRLPAGTAGAVAGSAGGQPSQSGARRRSSSWLPRKPAGTANCRRGVAWGWLSITRSGHLRGRRGQRCGG